MTRSQKNLDWDRSTVSNLYFEQIISKLSAFSLVVGNTHHNRPSKFFLALQSFCCRLSVVLLSYDSRSTLIRLDRTKKLVERLGTYNHFLLLLLSLPLFTEINSHLFFLAALVLYHHIISPHISHKTKCFRM